MWLGNGLDGEGSLEQKAGCTTKLKNPQTPGCACMYHRWVMGTDNGMMSGFLRMHKLKQLLGVEEGKNWQAVWLRAT